jgi:hypothetical protein
MTVPENFNPDKTATSHETALDEQEPEVIIVWLGDEKEQALNEYFEGFIPTVGWYWILSILPPKGPFETSKAAFDGYTSYIAEK